MMTKNDMKKSVTQIFRETLYLFYLFKNPAISDCYMTQEPSFIGHLCGYLCPVFPYFTDIMKDRSADEQVVIQIGVNPVNSITNFCNRKRMLQQSSLKSMMIPDCSGRIFKIIFKLFIFKK